VLERPATDGLGSPASLVLIDGVEVGRLRRGRPFEFAVAAGERLVTVWPANAWGRPIDPNSLVAQMVNEPGVSARVRCEPGERLELICQSNQPGLHPWVMWSACYFIFLAGMSLAAEQWPAVKDLSDSLTWPLMIGLALGMLFGSIGLVSWFRRAYAAGAFRGTVVTLTAKNETQRDRVLPPASDAV